MDKSLCLKHIVDTHRVILGRNKCHTLYTTLTFMEYKIVYMDRIDSLF